MNLKRGFLRFWIGISLCWIAGLGWLLHDDLKFGGPWTLSSRPPDCPKEYSNGPLQTWTDKELLCRIAEAEAEDWAARLNAAEIIFIPPLGLFVFGCFVLWVARGFRPKSFSVTAK
jgi:hypothetical protein